MEGRREDRLQLRCQRWRNRSGKEKAAHYYQCLVMAQNVAEKCSRRDFTEPEAEWRHRGWVTCRTAVESTWKGRRRIQAGLEVVTLT